MTSEITKLQYRGWEYCSQRYEDVDHFKRACSGYREDPVPLNTVFLVMGVSPRLGKTISGKTPIQACQDYLREYRPFLQNGWSLRIVVTDENDHHLDKYPALDQVMAVNQMTAALSVARQVVYGDGVDIKIYGQFDNKFDQIIEKVILKDYPELTPEDFYHQNNYYLITRLVMKKLLKRPVHVDHLMTCRPGLLYECILRHGVTFGRTDYTIKTIVSSVLKQGKLTTNNPESK